MKRPTVVFLRRRAPGKKLARKPTSQHRFRDARSEADEVFKNFPPSAETKPGRFSHHEA